MAVSELSSFEDLKDTSDSISIALLFSDETRSSRLIAYIVSGKNAQIVRNGLFIPTGTIRNRLVLTHAPHYNSLPVIS